MISQWPEYLKNRFQSSPKCHDVCQNKNSRIYMYCVKSDWQNNTLNQIILECMSVVRVKYRTCLGHSLAI